MLLIRLLFVSKDNFTENIDQRTIVETEACSYNSYYHGLQSGPIDKRTPPADTRRQAGRDHLSAQTLTRCNVGRAV